MAGDGGFQMTLAELITVVQEKVKINVAVDQQRLPGHGAPVAGAVLRGPLRCHADSQPGFREACRGVRHSGQRVEARAGVADAVARARATEGAALIEFRVEQEDSVYPMVPAGAALHEMIRRPAPSILAETGSDPV